MEVEPDAAGADRVLPGKRKRSPWSKPFSQELEILPCLDDQSQDVSGDKNTQAATKRQRVGTVPSRSSSGRLETPVARGSSSNVLTILPVEIMQHVMSFVDPFSLGRLMCVDTYFRNLLDPRQEPAQPSGKSSLPLVSARETWFCSRRTHLPSMPHPLGSVNELDMFRLTYGKLCQHCGKSSHVSSGKTSTTPWNSGPGPRGVRTVWPFKTRTCADCLRPLLIKETDFAQSGLPDIQHCLLSAVFTPSLHYVMSISLRQTAMPSGLHLSRYYYRPDVECVMHCVPEDDPLRQATHLLWHQQQDALRQEAVTDILRIEAWEMAQKPSSDILTLPSNVTSTSSISGSSLQSETVSRSYITASSGGYGPFTATSSHSGLGSSRLSSTFLARDGGQQHFLLNLDTVGGRQPDTTVKQFTNQSALRTSPPTIAQGQPRQTSQEVVRLKGEKRADIQRRCMALEPPIPPHVLDRLPAFQLALQVLMPIDEAKWETLKVQLLSQRRATEVPQMTDFAVVSRADVMDTSTVWRAATPMPETVELDYRKEASRPTKDKIKDFAMEYVHSHYAGGTGLTYSTAPQFAAQVLLYARERFYHNQKLEYAAFAAHGEQPPDEGPSGIRARTLKLDHMRYVFETSVKPYTEFVRKELFLCSACDTQGRHFQFEAIIQHYASKHTDSFSRDKAVVSWKSEWPTQSPFEPQPGRDLDHAAFLSSVPSASQLPGPARVVPREPQHASPIGQFGGTSGDDNTYAFAQRRFDSWRDDVGYEGTASGLHRAAPNLMPVASHQPLDPVVRSHDTLPQHRAWQLSDQSVNPSDHLQYRSATLMQPLAIDDQDDHHQRSQSWRRQSMDIAMTEADTGRELIYTQAQSTAQPTRYYERLEPLRFGNARSYVEPLDYRSDRYREGQGLEIKEPQQLRADTGTSPQRWSYREDERYHETQLHQNRYSPVYGQNDSEVRPYVPPGGRASAQYNVADQFLNTVDIRTVEDHERTTSKPATATHPRHPSSSNDYERSESILDRQSNTSQPRRQVRTFTHIDNERLPPVVRGNTPIIRYPEARRVYDDRAHVPSGVDTYSVEYRYAEPTPTRVRQYEEITDDPRAFSRQPLREPSRYADQHDRESEPFNPDSIRYMDSYREVVAPRPVYCDDGRAHDGYYLYPPYERQKLATNHETIRHYVDRPSHDYIYAHDGRHVQYEPVTGDGSAYESRLRYGPSRGDQPRLPPNEPRYEAR